mmetsp:Transcript_93710/g.269934  ORF Transcript_93710/g.269934 Transcript_93710/m.269934 type:complete len:247 (+) Transcript_93710:1133-1873(+)
MNRPAWRLSFLRSRYSLRFCLFASTSSSSARGGAGVALPAAATRGPGALEPAAPPLSKASGSSADARLRAAARRLTFEVPGSGVALPRSALAAGPLEPLAVASSSWSARCCSASSALSGCAGCCGDRLVAASGSASSASSASYTSLDFQSSSTSSYTYSSPCSEVYVWVKGTSSRGVRRRRLQGCMASSSASSASSRARRASFNSLTSARGTQPEREPFRQTGVKPLIWFLLNFLANCSTVQGPAG